MQVAMDFIEHPEVEPDRNCLNEIKEVEFLTPYTGEPALDFTKKSVYGVNLDIPTGWYKDGDFFIRYSSPFDVTQTGFVKVSSSTQEVMDYFSSSVYGYRGLDKAPTEVGGYEANGYIWRLYTSTSNGHPVDIGLTSMGSNTLFVTLISHADEHTALYDTVFLHMVDSAR